MKATDLVDSPAATDGPACWPEAAFDIIPDTGRNEPLRAAASAMTARNDRIFFIDTPFSACLPVKQAGNAVSHIPAMAGVVFAIERALRDLITRGSVRGNERQKNSI
jgi:hypothetical protein